MRATGEGDLVGVTPVEFPTRNPFLFSDLLSARRRQETATGRGFLFLPANRRGRLPATVVMEGLGGLKPAREIAYGHQLAQHGRIAFVVDSFGPRGFADHSHTWRALRVTEAMMVADAFAALHYLAARPDVDPDNITIMGFSYGGMIAVLTAYAQLRELFGLGSRRFAGHVSYYGSSVPRLEVPETSGAPVMLLLGELDRNVSIARSAQIADDLRAGGSSVDFLTISGAYHQWDSDDRVLRFVQFALAGLEFLLDRDHHIRDQRTGRRIGGFLSRARAIVQGTSLKGYHIRRDEAAKHVSDRMLEAFFQRVSEEPAAPRTQSAAE